jgi:uroporphyrinogen decarboxylase
MQLPTKRDLVMDAIAHKETWRIPHMIEYHADLGTALEAHYGVDNLDLTLGNAVEWIGDRLSTAALQATGQLCDGEYIDAWGVRWHGVGQTRGHVKDHPIKEPSLQGYKVPECIPAENLAMMQAASHKSQTKYRVAKLGALWEQATFLRGMEDLLVDLMLHPVFVHQLLDRIVDHLLANLDIYKRELDVECIWLSDDYGSQSALLMSPRLWRTFIGPRVRRVCDAVHQAGYRFALHSDGAIGEVVPDIVDIGVDLLHPAQSECMDVGRLKREFGSHITLWGAYGSQGTLAFGTPAQVRREVDQLCDLMGVGGGFILAPGLGLQNETPIENAIAFIEQANRRERGQ